MSAVGLRRHSRAWRIGAFARAPADDKCGSGCVVNLDPQLRPVEREDPSLGNANVTGVRIEVRRPDPVCALRPSLFSGP